VSKRLAQTFGAHKRFDPGPCRSAGDRGRSVYTFAAGSFGTGSPLIGQIFRPGIFISGV